jgi:UDP-N-acetylmuramyl pentapeptide phosphotransferase/UDP-N-acetylglucosamine-1-phosphate transferase
MSIDYPLGRAVAVTFLCALIALCVCATILWALLKTGLAWRLATDIPNERSLHKKPVPRVGGWGIVPVVAVLMWLVAPTLWMPALAAVLLAALSQIDDRRGLPARVRFCGHAAAVVALIILYPADVSWWGLGGLAFLLLWLVNLYNFMDGADGLAGGMALFGFGGYAIAALSGSHPDIPLAVASATVAGAAGGFLWLNFFPARIFLGDVGSIPLGYLAGALGYWGWRNTVWPIWLPPLMFAPFIVDASITLLKRLLRNEKFWQPHREHCYQRMIRMGTTHRRVALLWYGIMLAGMVIALLSLNLKGAYQWLPVVAWGSLLAGLGYYIDCIWLRFISNKSRSEVGET